MVLPQLKFSYVANLSYTINAIKCAHKYKIGGLKDKLRSLDLIASYTHNRRLCT
jgi:hypothetical protein